MRKLFVLVFLSCFFLPNYAQINFAYKEKMIDSLFQNVLPSSPGAAIVVVDSGKIVYQNYFGLANLEHGVPVSVDTKFHIASCTKTFTGYGILLLESMGELSLQDDIRKYLPQLPDFGLVVTIEHLLHHTSGMRGTYGIMLLTGWNWMDNLTDEEFMRVFTKQKELDFEPGKYYRYASTNYFLLARIIEAVSGETFGDWITENVFMPADMRNSVIRSSASQIILNSANPYAKKGDSYESFRFGDYTTGSDGIYSTAEDIAKWIIFFNNQKRLGSPILKKLTEPTITNDGEYVRYGRGIIVDKNPVSYWHTGSMAGFKTFIYYVPDHNHGVVVMNNFNFNSLSRAVTASAIFHPELHPDIIAEMMENWSKTGQHIEQEIIQENKPVISTKEMQGFEGFFRIEASNSFQIRLIDDTLIMRCTWENPKSILPISDDELWIINDNKTCNYFEDQSGHIIRIENIGPNGGDATRVQLPGEQEMKNISGHYYSKEVGLNVDIKWEDDRFIAILAHYRMEPVGLYFSKKNILIGDFNFFERLKFYRNDQNKITGFKLRGHRVSNMDFKKVIDE